MSNEPTKATALAPLYGETVNDVQGNIQQQLQYLTYPTENGWVPVVNFTVAFGLDRPPRQVWPYFKDFNLWQNAYPHYYSKVVGDVKEGETFAISVTPGEFDSDQFIMVKVIPDYGMVFRMDVPGVMGGFEVFMLHEEGGKTEARILMQHDVPANGMTSEQALDYWKEQTPEWIAKFRESFIPNLRKLISQSDP